MTSGPITRLVSPGDVGQFLPPNSPIWCSLSLRSQGALIDCG
jgi:hypothetical protein